jgi:hypothetical protein
VRLLQSRLPLTVLLFAGFVAFLVLIALVREGPQGRWIGAALLLLIATFGLVQGVWAAWLFLMVIAVGDIIVGAAEWPQGRAAGTVAINGCMLALLLAGSTRRYARRGRPRILARLGSGRLT